MKNIKYVDVVLDTCYGDSGKGKITFDLLNKTGHNLCIKFNGGANAGNTIYIKNNETEIHNQNQNNNFVENHNQNNMYTKMVLHLLPVGVAKANVYNLISSDCVVDIKKLKAELEYVKSFGFDITGRIFISKACHIITPECIEYDCSNNLVGSTSSGIGPTYANKMLRIGKRVEDYADEFESMGIKVVDMREFWTSEFVENTIHSVLCQGSQGINLDINWCTFYPYCTSSTCTLAGAINTGFPLKRIRYIYGVSKIYDTYVGAMKFQPENNNELELIGTRGQEFGCTTGRRRQCNYLNLDNLKTNLQINNCNICVINKVDILDELGIYKLYYNKNLKTFITINDMKNFIIQELIPYVDKITFSSNPYEI